MKNTIKLAISALALMFSFSSEGMLAVDPEVVRNWDKGECCTAVMHGGVTNVLFSSTLSRNVNLDVVKTFISDCMKLIKQGNSPYMSLFDDSMTERILGDAANGIHSREIITGYLVNTSGSPVQVKVESKGNSACLSQQGETMHLLVGPNSESVSNESNYERDFEYGRILVEDSSGKIHELEENFYYSSEKIYSGLKEQELVDVNGQVLRNVRLKKDLKSTPFDSVNDLFNFLSFQDNFVRNFNNPDFVMYCIDPLKKLVAQALDTVKNKGNQDRVNDLSSRENRIGSLAATIGETTGGVRKLVQLIDAKVKVSKQISNAQEVKVSEDEKKLESLKILLDTMSSQF